VFGPPKNYPVAPPMQLIATREPRPDTRPPPFAMPASSDSAVLAAALPANNESGSGSSPIRPQAGTILQKTRSGRSVKPPVRFKEFVTL
jgi:hypothetical protein